MKNPPWLSRFGSTAFVWMERHSKISWFLPILLIVWTFLYLYREEPFLSYKNLPFPVGVSKVRPGEVIPLHVVRCNSSRVTQTYLIARTLENIRTQQQFVLSDSIVQLKPGCHDETSLANQAPFVIPPGRYRILGLSQIQTDFRVHYVSWESAEFDIVPP